ncbi:hypothetical protein QE152_g10692 [Popillia japonica]|uniref:Uncharacterized protein n=1 Tax=Popillia japonica TaxID=7064 RepID=A0AAW1LU20_POPJA
MNTFEGCGNLYTIFFALGLISYWKKVTCIKEESTSNSVAFIKIFRKEMSTLPESEISSKTDEAWFVWNINKRLSRNKEHNQQNKSPQADQENTEQRRTMQ